VVTISGIPAPKGGARWTGIYVHWGLRKTLEDILGAEKDARGSGPVNCGHHGCNAREDEKAESEAGMDSDSDPSVRTRIAPDDSDGAGRLGSGWQTRSDPADSDRDLDLRRAG
jgi:hypothetical protein